MSYKTSSSVNPVITVVRMSAFPSCRRSFAYCDSVRNASNEVPLRSVKTLSPVETRLRPVIAVSRRVQACDGHQALLAIDNDESSAPAGILGQDQLRPRLSPIVKDAKVTSN
jgi:hypothetical protein